MLRGNPLDTYKLDGTGEGVCLLMLRCGIGDDICAFPAVWALAQVTKVTVYTHHKDLWANMPVEVVHVYGDEQRGFWCDNGDLLDMLWDSQHTPVYETIYKLNHWGGWEDDRLLSSEHSRFDQLAKLLDVELSDDFSFKDALPYDPSESKTVLAVESNEAYRALSAQNGKAIFDKLTNAVWLIDSDTHLHRPLMTRCTSWQELINIVGNADHVIAVDNGIAHLAAALGKRLTVIGGMTDVKSLFGHYEQYNAGWVFEPIQLPWTECDSPCYRAPERGFTDNKCCGKYSTGICMTQPIQILT